METVQTCAPNLSQNSKCVVERNSSFNESECVRNIMGDLVHYGAAIRSYFTHPMKNETAETELLRPTLGTIDSLKESCFQTSGDTSENETAKMWGNSSFDNRVRMCKMIKGFYVRAITINRALGYITSGDHKK
ncbi:interleukin-12 subunit alpha [Pholidichthys leucotaenia]